MFGSEQGPPSFLDHPLDRHGRLLAGPGTGKSTAVLDLAEKLRETNDNVSVRVITFTRAATAELADKVQSAGYATAEPVTVHAFSLSILMRNAELCALPKPLRIADDWEADQLVHQDIARRLRLRDFKVDRRFVARLEREMAAQWESLDPNMVLLANIDPELRNAYVAEWSAHRRIFGYSLFAEMPWYARQLLEDHPDLDFGRLDLLVVDEYQDLNRCEIAMMQALAVHGVYVVGVGDDDQSIYSFRMAAPEGIREFLADFQQASDYSLFVSHRCGSRILAAARTLIETTPGRPNRQPLIPAPGNPSGVFEYLRFPNEISERNAVVHLAQHLITAQCLRPSEIAILMRSDFNSVWSAPLRDALSVAGIPATDVEAALEPLRQRNSRLLLAIARLAVNPVDDLAWWAIMKLTRGVSDDLVNAVADEARSNGERFGSRLIRLAQDPPEAVSPNSLTKAVGTVGRVQGIVARLDATGARTSEHGWGDWVVERSGDLGIPLATELVEILLNVGEMTPQEEGLGHFLNQLEPVTKDLALRTEGVAIMTMTRSKGLTFRAAIAMGVEEGIIPWPRSQDEEEERRLLYVAITRAREFCYLTMATSRTGPTARTGATNVRGTRSRCPFFRPTDIRPTPGPEYVRELAQGRSAQGVTGSPPTSPLR